MTRAATLIATLDDEWGGRNPFPLTGLGRKLPKGLIALGEGLDVVILSSRQVLQSRGVTIGHSSLGGHSSWETSPPTPFHLFSELKLGQLAVRPDDGQTGPSQSQDLSLIHI